MARSRHASAAGWLASVGSVALWSLCAVALAEPDTQHSPNAPRAVVFTTPDGDARTPLDSAIATALTDLAIVSEVKRTGIDLVTVQLALDCVGETPKCLKAVTRQTDADELIAPALEQHGDELSLSLLRFDAKGNRLRRAVRRQPGSTLDSRTLALVPDLLRELYDLPKPHEASASPVEPAQPTAAVADAPEAGALPAPVVATPAASEESQSVAVPLAPLLIGGAGALTLGAGLISWIAMQDLQSEYDALPTDGPEDAREALQTYESGEAQETVTNVLLAVGGVAVAVAGVWLAIALSQDGPTRESQTAIVPLATPDGAALVWVQRGSGL